MFTKEQIRKNREKLRIGLQGCIVTVAQKNALPIITDSRKGPRESQGAFNRKRKASQDISLFKQQNMLKQIYISNGFNDLFEVMEPIGEGTQSVVYKCIQKQTDQTYAAKMIRSSGAQMVNMLKQQYKILKSLDHYAIIKAKYLFINEKEVTCHMVCQYYSFGNLRQHIMEKGRFKESEAAPILNSLLSGLAYIHKKGVSHRDLKPENLMFDPVKQNLKIIDFQIARVKKYKHQRLQMLTNTGTIYYKAPQLFKGGYYDQQVDMWAVGVIAYELLRGQPPFMSQYEKETAQLICESEPDLSSVYFTPLCQEFLKKCLNKNPLHRMTAQEALRSPFLLKYCGTSSTNSPVLLRRSSEQSQHSLDPIMEIENSYYDENTQIFKNLNSEKELGILQVQ